MPVSRSRAFTPIGLPIVVAIVAILAAIAAPNFPEAQTRAKVSRAQGDFRSLAMAIESCMIDHNSYPWDQDDQMSIGGVFRFGGDYPAGGRTVEDLDRRLWNVQTTYP